MMIIIILIIIIIILIIIIVIIMIIIIIIIIIIINFHLPISHIIMWLHLDFWKIQNFKDNNLLYYTKP